MKHTTTSRPLLASVIQYQEQLTSGAMDMPAVVERAHRLGVDGIELRREAWPAYQQELPAIRDQIASLGLLATYATFSTLFTTSSDEHQLLLHDIDSAAALGSPLLRVFPGAMPADPGDAGWERAREAIARAASNRIVIALENFGRTPGGRLAEISAILEQLPGLQTNIDIGNYAAHGEDVPAVIRAIGARAVYSHLKDQGGPAGDATVALGEGGLPLDAILTELDRLPQPVIYCFEFAGGDDPDARIVRSLNYLRARWQAGEQ